MDQEALEAGLGAGGGEHGPAELTCANPDDPCRLPNAFVDDPPLDQVVTRTVELGVRGDTERGLRWSVALFNAVSKDDILFISDGSSTSQGFFDNIGDTRRRGLISSSTCPLATKRSRRPSSPWVS